MSKCIKDLYNFELVKQCCKYKLICLKSNFFENIKRKDRVNSMCKICMNKYIRK